MTIPAIIAIIATLIMYIIWYKVIDHLIKKDDIWMLVGIYSGVLPAGFGFYIFIGMKFFGW